MTANDNRSLDADRESPSRSVSFWTVVLRGLCPVCGRQSAFDGVLALQAQCPNCAADLAATDPADGPAVFVTFLLGVITLPLALYLESFSPPVWLHFVIWPLFLLVLGIYLLRLLKIWLVALELRHDAHEARLVPQQEQGADHKAGDHKAGDHKADKDQISGAS